MQRCGRRKHNERPLERVCTRRNNRPVRDGPAIKNENSTQSTPSQKARVRGKCRKRVSYCYFSFAVKAGVKFKLKILTKGHQTSGPKDGPCVLILPGDRSSPALLMC